MKQHYAITSLSIYQHYQERSHSTQIKYSICNTLDIGKGSICIKVTPSPSPPPRPLKYKYHITAYIIAEPEKTPVIVILTSS